MYYGVNELSTIEKYWASEQASWDGLIPNLYTLFGLKPNNLSNSRKKGSGN